MSPQLIKVIQRKPPESYQRRKWPDKHRENRNSNLKKKKGRFYFYFFFIENDETLFSALKMPLSNHPIRNSVNLTLPALTCLTTCRGTWMKTATFCVCMAQCLNVRSGQQTHCVNATRSSMRSYLASEEATHTDDAENVEDGRAYDCPNTHVTFGDEHAWGRNKQKIMEGEKNLHRLESSISYYQHSK